MGPPSYMRSVVHRNVVMRLMTIRWEVQIMNLLNTQQVKVCSYLTLASNGGQRLPSLRGHFAPRGIAHGGFYKWGRLGRRDGPGKR